MDTISVIGIGAMGSALAQAFLKKNYSVTIWNRTKSKCDSLVDEGANLARTAASGVGASETVVICVTDYPASSEILETDAVKNELKGKLVVQFSTGTPQEARVSQAWVQDRGADYLDGAIMAFPRNIGTPDALILLAGKKSKFESHEAILNSLGTLRFLGENIGFASAFDCAILSFVNLAILGYMHGAIICESEELPIGKYTTTLDSILPIIGEELRHISDHILSRSYESPKNSSVGGYASSVERLLRLSQENGITNEAPDLASRIFKRAIAAGHAEHETAALIETFRMTASD